MSDIAILVSIRHKISSSSSGKSVKFSALVQQGTKIFQYCMSDLQFSLILQTHSLSFKRICNKEHKGVIYNVISSSNSFQSNRPIGRELSGELLILSRFHL